MKKETLRPYLVTSVDKERVLGYCRNVYSLGKRVTKFSLVTDRKSNWQRKGQTLSSFFCNVSLEFELPGNKCRNLVTSYLNNISVISIYIRCMRYVSLPYESV